MDSPQPSTTAAATSRLDDLQEWVGFACLVAFGYFVWPAAALLVAGVVLVVTANMRAAAKRPPREPKAKRTERFLDGVVRAIAAYRSVPDRGSS